MAHLGLQDLVPLGGQVVHDAGEGSFQGHTSDEQDGQHHVGKRGCEVHHLCARQALLGSSQLSFLPWAAPAWPLSHHRPSGPSLPSMSPHH